MANPQLYILQRQRMFDDLQFVSGVISSFEMCTPAQVSSDDHKSRCKRCCMKDAVLLFCQDDILREPKYKDWDVAVVYFPDLHAANVDLTDPRRTPTPEEMQDMKSRRIEKNNFYCAMYEQERPCIASDLWPMVADYL